MPDAPRTRCQSFIEKTKGKTQQKKQRNQDTDAAEAGRWSRAHSVQEQLRCLCDLCDKIAVDARTSPWLSDASTKRRWCPASRAWRNPPAASLASSVSRFAVAERRLERSRGVAFVARTETFVARTVSFAAHPGRHCVRGPSSDIHRRCPGNATHDSSNSRLSSGRGGHRVRRWRRRPADRRQPGSRKRCADPLGRRSNGLVR